MTTPIPVPPYTPIIGHLTQMDFAVPMRTAQHFADKHGEIYQLYFWGAPVIFVNSAALVSDVSNDQKFSKSIGGPLQFVRVLAGDALFTAEKDEPMWGVAHRLLMPSFRTVAIRDMFDDMLDITSQLILKWERFGPRYNLHPGQDFTRLTMDTLVLCSMTYRLNSFYREDNHPFVQAMYDFLRECVSRPKRPNLVNYFMSGTAAKFDEDMRIMKNLAEEILADRKANPIEKKDLLNVMLKGTDPKTGTSLSDDNIVRNLLTFLVAGHETSAGILEFAVYYLVAYPDAMRKAQAEVDDVLGDQQIQREDLNRLPYLTAFLREVFRLGPTIPFRQVYANEDTTIGDGKYFIPKGQRILVHIERAQKDPAVWGDDAEEFKPERMMDGKFERLPTGAWQPFGYGSRVCIGRPFVWQEALVALAMILQKFDLEKADPNYKLDIMQTLTVKPKGFYIHAIPRARKSEDA